MTKSKTKFAPMKITGFFEPPPQPPPTQPAPRPLTKEEKEWDRYFGFDGTCLEHDLHSCGICKRLATGRCFSSLEE